ncbi:hypothetical protein PHYPO_G00126920 [Pangasianodon hypophthalmus]|uniref:C2H2-type domain-containing protein n=1 Tax=Pangasianodon hypophthalmus TaxID=310915 RepID=A0A5N5KSC3_PANHP|nr:hypothetical protein PHYPO_G00126920 [Pangasianodon hypophthalmus]
MVKISSQCASSSCTTAKAAPDTHIKTEPCLIQGALNNLEPNTDKQLLYSCHGAKDFVSDNTSSELLHIKQEPGLSETDCMQTENRNGQPQSTDSTVSVKTEPDCVPVNLSFGLKTESEIHDVVNGEVYFPLKEEEEDVTKIKLETAEEESDLRQDEEAGRESFFSCPYCAVSFTDASYLEKHLKWTHRRAAEGAYAACPPSHACTNPETLHVSTVRPQL